MHAVVTNHDAWLIDQTRHHNGAQVSLLFHLSFSWSTYYLLGAKASTVTFDFLSDFFP